MKRRTLLAAVAGLLFFQTVFAQTVSEPPKKPEKFVMGVGLKLTVLLSQKNTANFHLSASVAGGTIQKVRVFPQSGAFNTMFSYHLTANLYKGGIGNSMLFRLRNEHQLDIINAFATTFGSVEGFAHDRMLYTLDANEAVPLRNPFKTSLTLAANFLTNRHNGSSKHRDQQIGYGGFCVQNFSLGYYNDGTPWHWLGLADFYDRYWTGGGLIHVGNNDWTAQFEVNFDKFTGFQNRAFEIANLLKLNYVAYADKFESSYNQSRFGGHILLKSGLSLTVSAFNFKRLDVQNILHTIGRFAFHGPVNEKRLMYGASWRGFYPIQKP